VSNLQLEYSPRELLETARVAEPLVVGETRCHGGFDEEGRYVSPRTRFRMPAIHAWQQHHRDQFGSDLLDVPLETWPEHYPNVAQAKFLLREGVRDPLVVTLTRIGTVEGFGAMIRYSAVPDAQGHFVDDIRGTAIEHLDRGLLEAHARDEAGYEDEVGHRQMWFLARDLALEDPVTEDQTDLMLQRIGLGTGTGGIDPAVLRRQMEELRVFPDLDLGLEMLVQRMIRILLIEISAFHVFAWAEEVLSDTDLVAGEGEAARLVSYIRQDETPHVEYLKTALTEMRDRAFVGESGRSHSGTDVIGTLWEAALEESLGERRDQTLQVTLREVELALEGHPRRDEILDEFHALGSLRPTADGSFVPSGATTGY
jgi:hypothetical protein